MIFTLVQVSYLSSTHQEQVCGVSIFDLHVSPFENIKYLSLARRMPLGSLLPLPLEFPSVLTDSSVLSLPQAPLWL